MRLQRRRFEGKPRARRQRGFRGPQGGAGRSGRGRAPTLGARALEVASRRITPARGLALVAVVAAVSLGASQYSDYRAVEVGAPEYQGLEGITPAPELERRSPRSAHGDWILGIAVASLVVIGLATTRNYRLARLLIFTGAAVIAISLAADAPRGLREGSVGIAYQGANAVLLGGFWAQLSSGVTLMVVGPLLAIQLRADRAALRGRRRPGRAADLGPAGSLADARPGSEVEGAPT